MLRNFNRKYVGKMMKMFFHLQYLCIKTLQLMTTHRDNEYLHLNNEKKYLKNE